MEAIKPRFFSKFLGKADVAKDGIIGIRYPDPASGHVRLSAPKDWIKADGFIEYTVTGMKPGYGTFVLSGLIDICPQNTVEVWFNNKLVYTWKTCNITGLQTRTDDTKLNVLFTGKDTLRIRFTKSDKQLREAFILLFKLYFKGQ